MLDFNWKEMWKGRTYGLAATPWDDSLKLLLSESPQDFVAWLFNDAQFLNKLSTEFPGRKAVADGLILAHRRGEEILVHFEFQSEHDPDMPLRMLDYSLRARREHKRLVYSCVIYLREVGEIRRPPLLWIMNDGHKILEFHYQVIELAKITPQQLKQTGLPGLFPLILLTRGGATRENVDEVANALEAQGKRDAITATSILASLMLQDQADRAWLKGRFGDMYETLEESWLVQEFMEKARQQERKTLEQKRQALEEEREREREAFEQKLKALEEERMHLQRVQKLRSLLLNIVEERFANKGLTLMAKGKAVGIQDIESLEDLIYKISTARNVEDAERAILEWPDGDVKAS